MHYKRTTQVPNFIFDTLLSQLTEAELKILLVVIRQTLGWIDKRSGKRKERDRITIGQFTQKTGLARRTVTKAIQRLLLLKLIGITDFNGCLLFFPKDRKGKPYLYYSFRWPEQEMTPPSAPR